MLYRIAKRPTRDGLITLGADITASTYFLFILVAAPRLMASVLLFMLCPHPVPHYPCPDFTFSPRCQGRDSSERRTYGTAPPECLEGEFSEVRPTLWRLASCLWWKGWPARRKAS